VGAYAKKKYVTNEKIREMENGESFSSLFRRVRGFLDEIDEKKYSAVSVCTHGAVIAAIKHLKTSGRFFFFQIIDYPKPGILTIIKNGEANTINFNKKA
jgi:broad specificity phosphatase PhoE